MNQRKTQKADLPQLNLWPTVTFWKSLEAQPVELLLTWNLLHQLRRLEDDWMDIADSLIFMDCFLLCGARKLCYNSPLTRGTTRSNRSGSLEVCCHHLLFHFYHKANLQLTSSAILPLPPKGGEGPGAKWQSSVSLFSLSFGLLEPDRSTRKSLGSEEPAKLTLHSSTWKLRHSKGQTLNLSHTTLSVTINFNRLKSMWDVPLRHESVAVLVFLSVI